MALTKSGIKRPNWSHLGRTGWEKERRREEEEEEEGGFKPRSSQRYGTWIFGMETEFIYEFYVIMYEFPCLVG